MERLRLQLKHAERRGCLRLLDHCQRTVHLRVRQCMFRASENARYINQEKETFVEQPATFWSFKLDLSVHIYIY